MMKAGRLKSIGKTVFWVAFVALISYAFVYSNQVRKEVVIEELEIYVHPLKEGSEMITTEEVERLSRNFFKENILKKTIGELPMRELEDILEKEPLIERADVFVDANKELKVEIFQRDPFLRVMENSGNSYYVDKKGVAFNTSRHYSPRIPIVTGYLPQFKTELMATETYKFNEIFRLVDFILEDELWDAMIEQIYVDEFGEFRLIPKVGDQQIILGSVEDLEDKFENLKIFYLEGLAYEGWTKYSSFNLKIKGQVIAERKID